MYEIRTNVRFDVVRGDVVRHVDFALHWLLASNMQFRENFFNDCSVHIAQNYLTIAQELNSGQIIDTWAIHHVLTFGCLLYPKERNQFWADQLGVRFLPFFQ